ncbi:MAG: hypothetical protein ACREJQ_02190 [bacterium]
MRVNPRSSAVSRILHLLSVAVVVVLVSARYSYFVWEFSGRLMDRASVRTPWAVSPQDFTIFQNFRWDHDGKPIQRRGWSISGETPTLPSSPGIVTGEEALHFHYSTGTAIQDRVMVGGSDGKLYYRQASSYTAEADFDTEKKGAGDTWVLKQFQNIVLAARGSQRTGGAAYLQLYDPGFTYASSHQVRAGIATSPTITLSAQSSGGLPDGSQWCYLVTLKKYNNVEGGGDITKAALITVSSPNFTVRVDVPETTDPNALGVKYFRIYRARQADPSAQTNADICGEFDFIKEIAVTQSTWDDDGTASAEDLDAQVHPDFGLRDTPYPFKVIEIWNNRVWAAESTDGATNPAPRGELWFSDVNCYDCWRNAHTIHIGRERGERIQCLHAFHNKLIVGTNAAIYAVVGDSPANFVVVPVSDNAACASYWAMAEADGVLYWLSGSTAYAYNGATLEPVGDDVSRLLALRTDKKDHYLARAIANLPNSEIWFALNPAGGSANFPTRVMVYNYEARKWAEFSFGDPGGLSGVTARISALLAAPGAAPQGYRETSAATENKLTTFEGASVYRDAEGTSSAQTITAQMQSGAFGDFLLEKDFRRYYFGFREPGATHNVTVALTAYFEGPAAEYAFSDALTFTGDSGNTGNLRTYRAYVNAAAKGKWLVMSVTHSTYDGAMLVNPQFLAVQYSEVRNDE